MFLEEKKIEGKNTTGFDSSHRKRFQLKLENTGDKSRLKLCPHGACLTFPPVIQKCLQNLV